MRSATGVASIVVLAAAVSGCGSDGSTAVDDTSSSPSAQQQLPTTVGQVSAILEQRNIPCDAQTVTVDGDGMRVDVLECTTPQGVSYRFGLGDAEIECDSAAKAKKMVGKPSNQLLPDDAASAYNDQITRVLVVGDGWWVSGDGLDSTSPDAVDPQSFTDVFGAAQGSTVGAYCDLQPIAT